MAAWWFYRGYTWHGAYTRRPVAAGCAAPIRAIRALICAWGGVLRTFVGFLWELRYRGLWMTPMDNEYRPETLIRDICGGNQRQHALASPCVGCPDAQGQRVCRKRQKNFFLHQPT